MDFQLRDVFDSTLVSDLAHRIEKTWSGFPRKRFEDTVIAGLDELSYGGRNELIADTLHDCLPQDFDQAVRILIDSLDSEPEVEELSGFDGFAVMPQCLFVSRYGLDHPDVALNALYEMTKRFTAEGDIRPFLRKYPEKTLDFLRGLTTDPSPFARRLASEGTRPRLPLGSRLPEYQRDPAPVLSLLERLKDDPNEMVRRSVANNLNDIAKDNPDVVVRVLERWSEDAGPERRRLTRHALRTLFKRGHPGALKLMGFDPECRVQVTDLHTHARSYAIGDDLTLSATIVSAQDATCRVMVDYVIGYVKANGKIAHKVFKGLERELSPRDSFVLTRKHSLRQMSTRVHYPGRHTVAVQINGVRHGEVAFELLPSP